MRSVLALTFLGLVCCRDNASTKPEGAANAATASASATASAIAPAASAPAPASSESPPAVTLPARSDIATTADEEKPVVLEGIYFAPEEARRAEGDEEACTDPVTLERPVRVLDKAGKPLKDGRGTGAHPTIGEAKRVCLWSFKGYEQGRKTMLPRGSRVVLRGKLSGPMTRQQPRAILVSDVEILSAVPASTTAPPNAFPDGDSVVFVRKVDAATRTLGLDLAYLYYGDAAEKLATERGEKLPSGQRWYIANDSPQLRSLVLQAPGPTSVGPKRLEGGWRSVSLDELSREPDTPYIVTFEGGVLKDFRQITFGGTSP